MNKNHLFRQVSLVAAIVATLAFATPGLFGQQAVSAPKPASAVAAPAAPTAAAPTDDAQTSRDQNGNAVPIRNGEATVNNAEATTERVFVTGSNIPTAAEVGPNPVLNVTRDLINKSGERTSEEILRNIPAANANGVPVSNNENGSNTAVGAATVALRGFDARATLILLDGRRVAPYPTGNRRKVFVDLNTIPQASIETIEILKDGASTTYGADAVAGVVNIKRYQDFRGAQATIEYGNTTDKDSGTFNTSLVFGVGNGTTNVSGSINYYHRNSIFNHDRSYSAVPPFLSSNASPYNLQVTNAAVAEAGGTVIPTESGQQFASAPNGTNGLAPASTYLYGEGRPRSGPNGFNFNEFSLSFPESERYGSYVAMNHKFLGDALVAYGDAMYQNVQTHNELAAPATGSFQTPGFVTLAIPPREPNPAGTTPLGGPTYAETGVTPGAYNPFNPFNQIISGGTRARLAEFGNRLFDNESEAFLATGGLRGDKLFNGTWGYDAGFRYSQIKNTTTGTQVSISRFNRILNQADPIYDPNSSEYIGTTTAFNPFGDFRNPIASNQASVDYARIHPKDTDTSKLATLDATIFTTSLFDLPAGGIGFALGGQFRRESLNEDPDQLNIIGDVAGNSAIASAVGGRKSYAFFVETTIPVFSEKNAIPGFHAFDISAAGRYEKFRNNNTDVAVPKVGVRWQPIDDSLTLRFTWGLGFREPSLEELYSAPISDIQPSHDPQNLVDADGDPSTPPTGAFEPETTTLVLNNPNLLPEDSESFSGGFVYTPKFIPGLTITTDLWQIERTGVVEPAFLDAVLARELTGTLLPGEVVERLPDNTIARIIVPNRNEAGEKANGIDFGIQYIRDTPFGTFTSLTQATYLNSFEKQRTAGGVIEQLAGQTTDPGQSQEGYYRWRANSQLSWAWHGFELVSTLRYIDGFHEQDADLVARDVDERWLFDLQGSYDFGALVSSDSTAAAGYSKNDKGAGGGQIVSGETTVMGRLLKGTKLTLGCINLFDTDPPFASGQGGNASGYPGFTYDSTGQFVYARLTKKF